MIASGTCMHNDYYQLHFSFVDEEASLVRVGYARLRRSMGKKKKPFINKKAAQTYRLVPRSNKDPLAGDVDESQYVLKLENGQEADGKEAIEEQKTYGIFFEDGYDYMQHLKVRGTASLEPVEMKITEKNETASGRQPNLPEELFGHEVTVQGHLEKVLPVSGPRPDWDPEIVEALENAEISSEPDEQLEDNFVMLATSSEPGVFTTEQSNTRDDTAWWKTRGDFEHSEPPNNMGSESGTDSDGESDAVSLGGGPMECDHDKRTARFTEYSMTSAVIPRSEALTFLDDQFEEFMSGYNDEQLGPGEEEGEGGGGVAEGACPDPRQSEYEQLLLQTAVLDYEKHFQEDTKYGSDLNREVSYGETGDSNRGVESQSDVSDDTTSEEEEEEEEDILKSDMTRKEDRWDCESILSTYSTLYNHPTRIVEPRTRVPVGQGEIKLSRKTGMPLGVIPGPLPKENHPRKGTVTRPKNEDKEEKRARRLAMKEDRKQRRADKKATKIAFKAEAMKQGKALLRVSAHTTTATVV